MSLFRTFKLFFSLYAVGNRQWRTCKRSRGTQNRLEITLKAHDQFPAVPSPLCPGLEDNSEKNPELLETHIKY